MGARWIGFLSVGLLACGGSGASVAEPANAPVAMPSLRTETSSDVRRTGGSEGSPWLLFEPLCAPSSSKNICEDLERAERSLVGAGGESSARALTLEVISTAPDSAEAWLFFGRIERGNDSLKWGEGTERTERAVHAFLRAHELEPTRALIQLELSRAYLALGRASAADPLLASLELSHPRDPEVQSALGVLLLGKGDVRGARRHFARAVELDSTSVERLVALGTCQLLLSDMTSAGQTTRRALALDPSSPEAHGNLGTILLLQGEVSAGRAHLERAVHLSPKSATYQANLAYAAYLEGNFEGAQKHAERALFLDSRLGAGWLNLALALAAQGLWVEAENAVEKAREIDPMDPRVQAARDDLKVLRSTIP